MTPGLDPTTISPSDALVAVRSFPRRWRGAFAVVADEEEGQELLSRGSPSALDLLAETVGAFRGATEGVRRIRAVDRPELPSPSPAAGSSLDDLDAAAAALAREIEQVPTEDWTRPGLVDGAETTALDVVRRAVIVASDDLREAEKTLRRVVGRP